MSECISLSGEYSEHVFDNPDGRTEDFVCSRCFQFSERAALLALGKANVRAECREAERDRARGIAVQLENENAKLIVENAALRAFVRDVAEHGLRHDLNPTVHMGRSGQDMYAWFSGYLRGADGQLRTAARLCLAEVADLRGES